MHYAEAKKERKKGVSNATQNIRLGSNSGGD